MLVWVVSAVGSVLAVGSAMLVGVSCLFSVVLAVGCRGMYGELLCMSFTHLLYCCWSSFDACVLILPDLFLVGGAALLMKIVALIK